MPDPAVPLVVVVDERIPLIAEWLRPYATVYTANGRSITTELLRETGASILIVRSTTRVHAQLLDGTAVETVCSATAGIDHIDTDYLNARGIWFARAPGSNADAVVEYVLAVIHRFRDVRNQTLGIVGVGNVGSRLARAAAEQGLNVLLCDPPKVEAGELNAITVVPLVDLLAQSTIVTLHVPLTHSGLYPTYHMINQSTYQLIADGSLLINTSRGGVVDEDCLDSRVDVVLDVFEGEPRLRERTVRIATHVTPHIAGYTQQAKINGAVMIACALAERLGLPELVSPTVEPMDAASRLDYGLREAWLSDPRPETFDRLRRVPGDLSR